MTSTALSSKLSASNAVQETLCRIQMQGNESAPRGQKVKESFVENLSINSHFPIIDFEARPFNWKYFMGEMAWYLTRDNNIEFINNFSSFWKRLAENGVINSNYGKILFSEQLQWAYDSLKQDPNTRQAISFVNQPKYQYENNKDFVCTMYLNFWIRDNELCMKVQMRSNDIFYGLTYDVPFFAFVHQTMWHWLSESNPELKLGTYHHCADNIHYYERHFEIAEKIADEPERNPIFFHLRSPLFRLANGNMVSTDAGYRFMEDVSNLLNSGEQITQEASRETLSKYFYIQ